jgi:hypothetical protein
MGSSLSWIAARGVDKPEFLRRLGLRDTGKLDTGARMERFSVAALPTGWTVLLTDDYDFAAPNRCAPLSAGAYLIACQIEEHVMASAAHGCANGQLLWSVTHDGDKDLYDLTASGAVPDGFAAIKSRLVKSQDEEAQAKSMLPVDYLFDAPVELAAALTGYRHDRTQFDWGEPVFFLAEPAR